MHTSLHVLLTFTPTYTHSPVHKNVCTNTCMLESSQIHTQIRTNCNTSKHVFALMHTQVCTFIIFKDAMQEGAGNTAGMWKLAQLALI